MGKRRGKYCEPQVEEDGNSIIGHVWRICHARKKLGKRLTHIHTHAHVERSHTAISRHLGHVGAFFEFGDHTTV